MSESHLKTLWPIQLKAVCGVSITNGALSITTDVSRQALVFSNQAEAEAAFEQWVSESPEEPRIRALLKKSDPTHLPRTTVTQTENWEPLVTKLMTERVAFEFIGWDLKKHHRCLDLCRKFGYEVRTPKEPSKWSIELKPTTLHWSR